MTSCYLRDQVAQVLSMLSLFSHCKLDTLLAGARLEEEEGQNEAALRLPGCRK